MATDIDDQISYEHRSFWNDAIRRFARNRLALTGLVIVGFVSFLAIFADLLAPFPYDHAMSHAGVSSCHTCWEYSVLGGMQQ